MSALEFGVGELAIIRAALDEYAADIAPGDYRDQVTAMVGDIDAVQPVVYPGTSFQDTGDVFITLGEEDEGGPEAVAVGSYLHQHTSDRWTFLTPKQARAAAQLLLALADQADEENGR